MEKKGKKSIIFIMQSKSMLKHSIVHMIKQMITERRQRDVRIDILLLLHIFLSSFLLFGLLYECIKKILTHHIHILYIQRHLILFYQFYEYVRFLLLFFFLHILITKASPFLFLATKKKMDFLMELLVGNNAQAQYVHVQNIRHCKHT